MADILSEDEVREWFDKLELSKKWREPKEMTWRRTNDYLKNKYLLEESDDDQICINMVYPHVRVVIPSIYSKNPDVSVIPTRTTEKSTYLARKRAEIIRNVIRHYYRVSDIKSSAKLAILDAIIMGHGWIKSGIDIDFDEPEDFDVEKSETIISKFLKQVGLKAEEESEDDKYWESLKIVNELAWSKRASPYDMFVPALSKHPDNLYWIAERYVLPYDQVMENPDFRTTDLKPSCNGKELLNSLPDYQNVKAGDKLKYSILYEVYDRKSGTYFTLAEGHKKVLEKDVMDFPFDFIDNKFHPYRMLRFNEVSDEFYPQSDIEVAEPQLLELNSIRTKRNIHLKRYNRRYFARAGALKPEDKEALKVGEDGLVIEIDPTMDDKPLMDIMQPITDAALPPEVYALEQNTKDDILNILGTQDYASAGRGARTATEASIQASQSRFRVEERIDIINDFMRNITKDVAQICLRYYEPETIEKIVGMDSMFWEQIYSNEELQSEYLFDVVYGSTTSTNREVALEQFMKFYAMARNDPYYDQVKIRLELNQRSGLPFPESWFNTQVIEALEQQLMLAAQAGLVGPAAINQAGTPEGVGRVPDLGKRGERGSSDPSASGEPLATAPPEVPGGIGGTALA